MKNYSLLYMLLCFAIFSNAQDNFDKQWQEVLKYESEGLTKSAAELVDSIYDLAKTSKNVQQRIKALLYKSKYMLTLEDEAQAKIVALFTSEIEASESVVTKHLLENMLATMYWQYFQQNRYRFYNRSNTAKKQSDDFRTWDLATLFHEIHMYYQRSLQNALVLQQESLEQYTVLINETKNSKVYRPSLYDLLSHNALQFYKTDENSITQPAYKFVIDQANYLSDSEDFINLDLTSKDSLALQLNALKIYQNLMRFHRSTAVSPAFATLDIERLNFVLEHTVLDNKYDLFLTTMLTKATALKDSELSALYNFEIASLLKQQGNKFEFTKASEQGSKTMRWKLKEALELCNSVMAQFPNSEGAKKCDILKQQILQPSLRLLTEAYVPINKASRILVTYSNLTGLDFSIYKITKKQLEAYDTLYSVEDQLNFFKKLKVQKSFKSNLKSEGDYQVHGTELVIPELANGLYLIKAKTNTASEVFATAHIQLSNLALIESFQQDTQKYQLVDRSNGAPIVGSDIQITHRRNRDRVLLTETTTNRYGMFEFKKDKNPYRQVEIKANFKNDTAYFGDYYIARQYKESDPNSETYNTFLFADRSIYRPGQTVYFKAIVAHTKAQKTSVVNDEKITATLHNVNGEKLSERELVTNAFGSIHGEFMLPNDGLTGQFYIQTNSVNIGRAYSYFSVEDYKRPQFKTEFEPITETFKVNDSISVKGNALAFAGTNISNAKVMYNVKRQVQFPSWYYWRNPYYNSETQEITFGQTQTNTQGEFDISFMAIPDESVSKENLPVFRYEVTADVTDINGETRSATTIVNVGYHAMTINIVAPETIDKSKKKYEISLDSKNLNGEYAPAQGTIKVYKLRPPQTVLRPRPWAAPDYQAIPEAEFKTLFPHDAYTDENLIKTWEKGEEVFNATFDTEKVKTVLLKRLHKWESGRYKIVVESQDKFGQAVKDEAFITLYGPNDKHIADMQLFEGQLNKNTYQPGEQAVLTIGSAAEDIVVTVEVEKRDSIISTQLVRLNDSKQSLTIPVTENDLGGFVVHCSFAAFNAYQAQSFRVEVPYPNTYLTIETNTFRDKLQPGQDETWSFTIKGPEGDKVTAELLASMYDASLDEFKPHNWSFNPISGPLFRSRTAKNHSQSFGINTFRLFNQFERIGDYPRLYYDQLNWFGFYFGNNYRYQRKSLSAEPIIVMDDAMELEESIVSAAPNAELIQTLSGEAAGLNISKYSGQPGTNTKAEEKSTGTSILIRKNLNETAFFLPLLQTDAEGNVSFNFKAPEALTIWKLQLLAHTKTLESAVKQLEAVTQKELMVIPNAPRFLREGDQITISTKIANLTDKSLSGMAQLQLSDPISGTAIDSSLLTTSNSLPFTVDAKGNTQVSWNLTIPEGLHAVQYKVLARAGDFSDGEQNALPILSNRMLVTETLPMWIRSNETKTFTLEKLKSNKSTTLKNHKLTLEITSNPAWYAVQALPYLMEYPYDCNEQTFARYYANALAQHIVQSNPKIEAVFNQWKSQDVLLSNLEKNQELKSILIQETPWLRDAQSETEQKKRIGLLFDLNKMTNELLSTQRKLKNNQLPSGAWPWFNGGRANRYITQHIMAGFGHLKHLNVSSGEAENGMVQNAMSYLDAEFIEDYNKLIKYKKDVDLRKDHLSYIQLHYLYVRSFYPEIKISKELKTIMAYYQTQIQNYWLKRSLYAKGLMALTMYRMEDIHTSTKILKSLKENSITSDELGMYWKANTNSWHWYQAPIETQALLIEAFSEIENDTKTIDNLKIWLLKNKQTNQWKTTKATTEAVYALLLQGSTWLDVTEMVDVQVGDEHISPSTLDDVVLEAGSGYYKTSWTGLEISPSQANVTLIKKGDGIAWGAMYWQYFEDLDKITSAETPLKLRKTLFIKTNTDNGEEISEVADGTAFKVGDLVRVRIELKSDRTMEFVHLKDMRAAGFEPVNVLSQYKWQDGLGYYESTRDATTNFFIDFLPKGVYVFEYDLRVNNSGDMSNGISTIQSMYAPEFSSHSGGVRVLVD